MPTEIAVIPGAGYDKFAYWPLVDAGLVPLSYRRKKDRRRNREVIQLRRSVDEQYGIRHYARRVMKKLLAHDREVNLLCHSMGWVIAQPLLDALAEKKCEGLVKAVIGLTPAITGGPPKFRFYRSPYFLGARSMERVGSERPAFAEAVETIRQHHPDFDPRCAGEEVFRALIQSVQGVIPETTRFPHSRMFVFSSFEDHLIPPAVTEHMLERNGIQHEQFSGYGGHSAPVVDIEGGLLQRIQKKFLELEDNS